MKPLVCMLCIIIAASSAQAEDKLLSIAFRLANWKSLHFDNPVEAQKQVQTLKQLGCEVQTEQHAGHFDVRFRASKWTKLTVDNPKLIDDWEKWLKATGFKTLHGNDNAPVQGVIAVHYRMPRKYRMHLDDAEAAKEFVAIFMSLGCSVQEDRHGGHVDLTINSLNWLNLTFDTHDEAHAIQKWLDEHGFETRHNH